MRWTRFGTVVTGLVDLRLRGNKEVLDALAVVSGVPRDSLDDVFRSMVTKGAPITVAADVSSGIEAVIRHVLLAPIGYRVKPSIVDPLKQLLIDPPSLDAAYVSAWHRLRKELPITIVDVERSPVDLPPMVAAQAAAWHALLDLEEGLNCHWSLIGGQMVTLICAEHGQPVHRVTDDGDVVLGVWLERGALKEATNLLRNRGFEEDSTSDGYGYRYSRGGATIDLLLPEEISRQDRIPTTATGRPGIEVPGGNQALVRSERLPVRLAGHEGRVRRPNLLGALVAKAAASVADTRDSDRHREDMAILGQIALTAGAFRAMRQESKGKDRRRLRRALAEMPASHPAWRRTAEPDQVRAALARLSAPPAQI